MKAYLDWLVKRKVILILLVLFAFELFFKAYQLDIKNPFGYDQVDNAWAAKDLIVNHKYPLVGMVAKANSGIYIGPLYYYLVAAFYFVFNLNPIASGAIAVASSVFTFFVIYFVFKNLLNEKLAIFALIINVFSFNVILFDRIQWPVQLLPAISLLIFYFLYKIIQGDLKKIIALAILVGISFHLHFTAIFFPLIILLCLPLFPRKKETVKYILISLPLFLVFLLPNVVYSILNKNYNSNLTFYLSTYFHGFHLQRMLQIVGDAVIQFDYYLVIDILKKIKFIFVPLFIAIFLYKNINSDSKKLCYITALWFLIPWLVFTTYSGELTDYYFIINKFIALFILAYFVYRIWNIKFIGAKFLILAIFLSNAYFTITNFLPYKNSGNLLERKETALKAVNENKRIEFHVGVPETYLYWYYMKILKGKDVY